MLRASRLLSAWIPVAIWLVLIAMESTTTMGAGNTARWINAFFRFLHHPLGPRAVLSLNHWGRKCGHFFGYGILGVLFTRAFLISGYIGPIKLSGATLLGRPLAHLPRQCAAELSARAFALGLAATALVASCDEFHQRFLPGRTAAIHDVLLDCTGAVILIVLFSPHLRSLRSLSSAQ